MAGSRLTVYLVLFAAISSCALSQFEAINFPQSRVQGGSKGDRSCHKGSTQGPTVCKSLASCPEVMNQIRKGQTTMRDVRCRPKSDSCLLSAFVCCPVLSRNVAQSIDFAPPKGVYERCGRTWEDNGFTDLRTIYEGNQTLEEYISRGYEITNLTVHIDQVTYFDWSNGEEVGFFRWSPRKVAGGEPARRALVVYMALLGTKDEWLCDGVLISEQYVLTAAHCFDNGKRSPNIVRLGEYDTSDDTDTRIEVPLDYTIESVVIHPSYSFPASYHDLAIVKLPRKIPRLRYDLIPLCLPWGERASDELVGRDVTLTGWGASYFLGPSTAILQEANITVFPASRCEASYSTLSDYRKSFPNRITSATVLCAGHEDGGIDACQGDSGGPIVYLDEENRFTLAGVVATGNGCGLKEFPGIYIPINKPEYLSWIKSIVFREN